MSRPPRRLYLQLDTLKKSGFYFCQLHVYNSVAYLKNLFEKGIECDILKASFSSLAYQIEFYILGRINVSLKCSRLPVFIAVIDLQQYLTEQVICFNFQSVYTGVMITLFD